MKQVKLIWEFRGADSSEIATHHAKHLQEFCKAKSLRHSEANVETFSDLHSWAWLKIEKAGWEEIAKILKPHKVVEESS